MLLFTVDVLVDSVAPASMMADWISLFTIIIIIIIGATYLFLVSETIT